MSIQDHLTLTRLLARLSLPAQDRTPSNVREQPDVSLPSGATVDLYEPRGKTRGTVVAVHGVTVRGGRDDRLVHFARSLAAVGVACAVPTLPQLAACQWEPTDGCTLGEAFDLLEGRTDRRPGLIGFSHGASYALVLAAEDRYRDRVRFVLAFGPYHDLEDLLRHYAEAGPPDPRDEEAVDNWHYLHFVLAHGLGEGAGVSGYVLEGLADLMGRYCHHASSAEKAAFFEHHIAALDMVSLARRLRSHEVLASVSPAGKLASVRCPVSLVHDVHDGMVPPVHAERIYEELCARGHDAKQTLLLTRLLSHVALKDAFRVGEAARLIAALRPIVFAG
jgi:hypothetical protein